MTALALARTFRQRSPISRTVHLASAAPILVAYTYVLGSYPPLQGRIEAGEPSSSQDPVIMDLLQRVEVVGHRVRPAFAPRITVHMRIGSIYHDEFRGNESEWDLATEIRWISALLDDLPWPEASWTELFRCTAQVTGKRESPSETEVDLYIYSEIALEGGETI